MTEDEILEYVNKTNLPDEAKADLYDKLIAARTDADRTVIKAKYAPQVIPAKDATIVKTERPLVVSTNPNDRGYWGNLTLKQLRLAAMEDPFSGVANPDGSFNQQAFGKWLGRLVDESNARARKNIANGDYEGASWLEKVGAVAGQIFMPRMHEAYERGEEPSWKDYGLDVTQNVAYVLPVGMAAGAVTRGMPLAARLGAAGAANFAVPAAMEGLDRIAYDGEDTDRSQYSLNDVLVGGAVNLGTPLFIKGSGAALGSTIGGLERGTAREVADALRNFGVDPKATALETIKKAEASVAAHEIPAYGTMDGKVKPWIDLDALGADGISMEAKDAMNTLTVGKGIEDGSIKFVPTKGKVVVNAPEHIVDDSGILRKVGAGDGNIYGNVEVGGKQVSTSPLASKSDLNYRYEMDYTSPDSYFGTNRYQKDAAIIGTIKSHPELANMRATMAKRIKAQAPMNYGTNMMGKSEYAKKAESGIPFLGEAIAATAKDEREARWARGKVTFEEQHSPEYQKWWMQQRLGY